MNALFFPRVVHQPEGIYIRSSVGAFVLLCMVSLLLIWLIVIVGKSLWFISFLGLALLFCLLNLMGFFTNYILLSASQVVIKKGAASRQIDKSDVIGIRQERSGVVVLVVANGGRVILPSGHRAKVLIPEIERWLASA